MKQILQEMYTFEEPKVALLVKKIERRWLLFTDKKE